ncbi:Lrp/AsnC ligand binding domain-containing protein [Thalassolituus sp. LLYu03]|uniref:Lrp/AsnC ligand binding domain-containing protein n=1 Tax=Thalassolituus sp. LLYu03 TaxID=3421656 RepID=UPI003D2DCF04
MRKVLTALLASSLLMVASADATTEFKFGGFDYLLKGRTTDMAAYREVLSEQISSLPHVLQTSTYVTMKIVKDINSKFLDNAQP